MVKLCKAFVVALCVAALFVFPSTLIGFVSTVTPTTEPASLNVTLPFGDNGATISFEGKTVVPKTHVRETKVVFYDPETEQRSKPISRRQAEALLQSSPHGVIVAPDRNGTYNLPDIDRVEYEPATFSTRFAAASH